MTEITYPNTESQERFAADADTEFVAKHVINMGHHDHSYLIGLPSGRYITSDVVARIQNEALLSGQPVVVRYEDTIPKPSFLKVQYPED